MSDLIPTFRNHVTEMEKLDGGSRVEQARKGPKSALRAIFLGGVVGEYQWVACRANMAVCGEPGRGYGARMAVKAPRMA